MKKLIALVVMAICIAGLQGCGGSIFAMGEAFNPGPLEYKNTCLPLQSIRRPNISFSENHRVLVFEQNQVEIFVSTESWKKYRPGFSYIVGYYTVEYNEGTTRYNEYSMPSGEPIFCK